MIDLEEIYRDLDLTQALTLLDPKDRGKDYLVTCPACGKREAFVYKVSGEWPVPRIRCSRKNKCGITESVFDYVMRTRGLDVGGTIRELARLAGVTLPDMDPEAVERIKQAHAQAEVWETALAHFQDELAGEKGVTARAYLEGRGYSPTVIEGMELGLYTGTKDLAAYLKSRGVKKDQAEPVLKTLEGTPIKPGHKVVIPYRDPRGRVIGFTFRATDGTKPKYLYTKGIKRSENPFNLDRARGQASLIVVEGILDALAVRERAGLKNVIGIGGSTLSESQLDQALESGAKGFTLALDNDPEGAGQKGTDKAIGLLQRRGFKAYVITLPLKDPDEVIREKGPKAFIELVQNAQSGLSWRTNWLAGNYKAAKNDEERDQAKEALVALGESLENPLDLREYTAGLSSLGIPPEYVEKWLKDIAGKKAQERIRSNSWELLEGTLGKLKAGDALDLGGLEGRVKGLRLEAEKIKARPTETLAEHLREKQEEDSKRGDELLGFRLNRFNEIAKKTDGIQSGFYIIGAYTSKGKTALATNLFLDLLQSNPGTKGLYFSLDDNRDVIINRFLGILTGLRLNQVQRKQADPEALNEAYGTLVRFAEEGRLIVKDISEVSHIDTLEMEIRERAGDKNLFVVIDGLYNLETGSDYGGIREENVERANKVKTLVDTYEIPIIATGELRKRTAEGKDRDPSIDDLMETGKFAYNANLVWLLYPEEKDPLKYDEDPEPVLVLRYEKNKLSYFTGKQDLTFKKATGRIKEKGLDPAAKAFGSKER